MIRLGLRLTVAGGREALVRLAITAFAVALGVSMLLAALAGIHAVNAQNARYAWLETGAGSGNDATSSTADPLWWRLAADMYDGKTIGRVDLAATGPSAPVPPGMPRLPANGEYYVSPAMDRLLRSVPADQLAARYPGHEVGVIGSSALPSPDSLVIVLGRTAHDMAAYPDAKQVSRISTMTPSQCNGDCVLVGINGNGIDLVLSVATAALIFPVLVFIGTATRLNAARREQRFAAMRLVGATPRQISVIAAVESTVASGVGVALGFALMWSLRSSLARIPFTGSRFFVADLSLDALQIVAIALGVPLAAAIAARIALRRVQISPLGVTRRVTPRPLRWYRVIPLLLGIGLLAYFAAAGRPASTAAQIRAFLPAFLLIMVGLVVGGPWLTMRAAQLAARRTGRPSVLVAARRLGDDPRAGFRAISGLVLALFVATVAVGTITTINAYDGGRVQGSLAKSILIDDFDARSDRPTPQTVPASALAQVRATHGVVGVVPVYYGSDAVEGPGPGPVSWVVSCADLAATSALGRCAPGARTALIDFYLVGPDGSTTGLAHRVWPAATLSPAALPGQRAAGLLVQTDHSVAANERVRTVLERAEPSLPVPITLGEQSANQNQRDTAYQRLADVVILASLPIAGLGLAASIVTGVNERRRPFSLLRLTGTPIAALRRVVAFETAVPLLLVSAAAIGVGFLATALFTHSQLHETMQPPQPSYYAVVAAGLVLTLCIIASTFPLLRRVTGPEAARND